MLQHAAVSAGSTACRRQCAWTTGLRTISLAHLFSLPARSVLALSFRACRLIWLREVFELCIEQVQLLTAWGRRLIDLFRSLRDDAVYHEKHGYLDVCSS